MIDPAKISGISRLATPNAIKEVRKHDSTSRISTALDHQFRKDRETSRNLLRRRDIAWEAKQCEKAIDEQLDSHSGTLIIPPGHRSTIHLYVDASQFATGAIYPSGHGTKGCEREPILRPLRIYLPEIQQHGTKLPYL